MNEFWIARSLVPAPQFVNRLAGRDRGRGYRQLKASSCPFHRAQRRNEFGSHHPFELAVAGVVLADLPDRQGEPPARGALAFLGRSVSELFSDRARQRAVLQTCRGEI